MADQEITEQELHSKLAALGKVDDETRNRVTCALIGHSHIITGFFGYQYCGRCGEQIGDTLAGFGVGKVVLIGHNCDKCRTNYADLDWKHKLFVPDPFASTDEATA